MELGQLFFPVHKDQKRFIVFSGIDQAAVYQGICRKNTGIGILHILEYPSPDFIRLSLIVAS